MGWFSKSKETQPVDERPIEEQLAEQLRAGGGLGTLRDAMSSTELDPKFLGEVLLNKNIHIYIRMAVANNPSTPPDALESALLDVNEDRDLRDAVVSNPSVKAESLGKAVEDPRFWEKNDSVFLNHLMRSDRTPVESMSRMILEHPPSLDPANADVVGIALTSPRIPGETIRAVLDRMDDYREPEKTGELAPIMNRYNILSDALRNPNAPADRVHEILFNTQEPDHRLRLAAMESPHTSAEDVIKVLENPSEPLDVTRGAYDLLVLSCRDTVLATPKPSVPEFDETVKAALIRNYDDTRKPFPAILANLEQEVKSVKSCEKADSPREPLTLHPEVRPEGVSHRR